MSSIGLVSDTHGLRRPRAEVFLAGSDCIVHAGDVGGAQVLEALAATAPLTVVRGDVDHGDWVVDDGRVSARIVDPETGYRLPMR